MTTKSYTSARRVIEDGLYQLSKGTLSPAVAAKVLAKAAFLRLEGEFPLELDYPAISRILEIAMGRDLDPARSPAEVRASFEDGPPAETIRLVRGVEVTLTTTRRLDSVSVRPAALAEGRKLMSIVGIGHDTARDVAEHHDDYLIDAYLNG